MFSSFQMLRTLAIAGSIAGVLIAVGYSPVTAASRSQSTFGTWQVVCVEPDDKPKSCTISKSLVDPKSKRPVLNWSISFRDDAFVQSIAVPAGVSIKEGVRVFIGESEPITLGYETCGRRVCMANGPLPTQAIDLIKANDKASVSFVRGSKQLVQVPVELGGFAEAYDYLVQQLS